MHAVVKSSHYIHVFAVWLGDRRVLTVAETTNSSPLLPGSLLAPDEQGNLSKDLIPAICAL